MKKNIFTLALVLISYSLFGQTNGDVYDISSTNITFTEGKEGLLAWLRKNAEFPEDEHQNDSGVIVFIIEKDGSISNIKADCDNVIFKAEMIRLVKSLGIWKPAMLGDKLVRHKRVFRFSFVYNQPNKDNSVEIREDNEEEEIFQVVEQQAEFPQGGTALFKWIEANVEHPEGIYGKVILRFIVEKDGRITNAVVLSGAKSEIDEAALRVTAKMPNWLPGKQRGYTVRSYYTLTVVFK